jgi:hypothetical protein
VTPAAIGNAIFDATGARLRDLPFTPERVKAALLETDRGAQGTPLAPWALSSSSLGKKMASGKMKWKSVPQGLKA